MIPTNESSLAGLGTRRQFHGQEQENERRKVCWKSWHVRRVQETQAVSDKQTAPKESQEHQEEINDRGSRGHKDPQGASRRIPANGRVRPKERGVRRVDALDGLRRGRPDNSGISIDLRIYPYCGMVVKPYLDRGDFLKEQWAWIIYNGHDMTGKYMISTIGRVRSVERYTKFGQLIKDRILRQRDSSGRGNTIYKEVTLSDNGKVFDVEVHRLVATAFIPNPESKRCVNHIDGNGSNNCVENLEWCSHSENMYHSVRKLGNNSRKWSAKPVKQMTEDGSEVIKVWHCAWDVQRELGISQVGVSRAARRFKKSGIFKGYRWDFVGKEYDECQPE